MRNLLNILEYFFRFGFKISVQDGGDVQQRIHTQLTWRRCHQWCHLCMHHMVWFHIITPCFMDHQHKWYRDHFSIQTRLLERLDHIQFQVIISEHQDKQCHRHLSVIVLQHQRRRRQRRLPARLTIRNNSHLICKWHRLTSIDFHHTFLRICLSRIHTECVRLIIVDDFIYLSLLTYFCNCTYIKLYILNSCKYVHCTLKF